MSSKITAGIIDDEQYGRDYLSLLLHNEFPDMELVFTAANVTTAHRSLTTTVPDLLFLDIELGDGNAFDLLSELGQLNTQIIFVTAYEHYAIQAIKNNAVDYLLKPVKRVDFVTAVNKAIERIKKDVRYKDRDTRPTINLYTAQGFKKTNVSDIIRCEADSNYTIIYLADKTKIMISRTLQDFENYLSVHDFFRIHHKHLINLKHLKQYVKGKGGQVIMSDDSVLDVSVRRKNDFLSRIRQ